MKIRDIVENFADGKGPGRPGDSKRAGIPKGATIAQLKKYAVLRQHPHARNNWHIGR